MYQVHYCEFSRQNDANDHIFRPNGSGDWLFLLFLAPMQVTFRDHTEIAQAGGCLLYSPEDYQDYRAVGVFRNSYIHFGCDGETPLRYGLPQNRTENIYVPIFFDFSRLFGLLDNGCPIY